MKFNPWLCRIVTLMCMITGYGCASIEGNANTRFAPTPEGTGIMAQMDVEFEKASEVPGIALKCFGEVVLSVTQPIHLYHYIRDNQGRKTRNKEGELYKVWFPFWRIIGEHHGDSVVGLIYDHGWLSGWDERTMDKAGKLTGLILLIWAADETSHILNSRDGAKEFIMYKLTSQQSSSFPAPAIPESSTVGANSTGGTGSAISTSWGNNPNGQPVGI